MFISFFLGLCSLVLLAVTLAAVFWRHRFGAVPFGERLEHIRRSSNYGHGSFRNKVLKPQLTEGATFPKILLGFLLQKKERPKPALPVPVIKTELNSLDFERNSLIWFGHSSYFLQLAGKRFLVDPHLSASASPLPFSIRAFSGSRLYSYDDIPAVDYTLITHDHWDHLDYETITCLKEKTGTCICGLGVGAHLELWGVSPDRIKEVDWDDATPLSPEITLHTLTAHHYSGRVFRKSSTLWVSFLLEAPSLKVYFGGDGGYGPHFFDIGNRFGPIDLAVLENGQYDAQWKYIHMQPEETWQAAIDLRAYRLFPGHSGKFEIANHPWDEPLQRIAALGSSGGPGLVTPVIGEEVLLDDVSQTFTHWWEGRK